MAVARKVLSVGRVGTANGEGSWFVNAVGVSSSVSVIVSPYLLGQVKGRPSFGPAGVKGHVGDGFGYFGVCDAIVLADCK